MLDGRRQQQLKWQFAALPLCGLVRSHQCADRARYRERRQWAARRNLVAPASR